MKKQLLFGLICLIGLKFFGQRSINDYKYVVVPNQYAFLGYDDKYQLNSLTKFLFNKYGYTAFLEGEELPADLQANGCLAMYANLLEDSSMFKTKLQLEVKDCNGTVIKRSETGETREKAYDKAFNLALRQAFESFQNAEYKYVPVNKTAVNKTTEVEPVGEKPMAQTAVVTEVEDEVEAEDNMDIEEILVEPAKELAKVEEMEDRVDVPSDLLYAQPIDNGFQIVDTEPKKVMVLYKSGMKDVFIVDGKNAVVYKKDGIWYYDEYNSKLETKTLNIKF
ncbi:hypothetical protein SAMN03097699_3255 [Flavobacteriaceae bacterium MAR_2010_188]|nr:hypothetical protein SAMN03097699_3255 [Flavobacteriaceae bacterium MAR_2010_188]